MDWFSWLSRTGLEPSLVYEYGLAFARNELQFEDAIYFNHEFLQSMGISIAKHRLEILKLAKKEDGTSSSGGAILRTKNLSMVIKKCLRKCMSMVFLRDEEEAMLTKEYHQGKWRRALVKGENNNNKGMQRSRTIALSGPLDGRIMHEKMLSSKVLKLSGPLEGRINERIMYPNRSPKLVDGRFMGTPKSPTLLSGPLDARAMVKSPRLIRPSDERGESPMGYSPYNNKTKVDSDYDDEYAMWPTLFEDLKPT